MDLALAIISTSQSAASPEIFLDFKPFFVLKEYNQPLLGFQLTTLNELEINSAYPSKFDR